MAKPKDQKTPETVEETKNPETVEENTENSEIEFEEITLVTSAEYWKFDEHPEFIGKYVSEVISKKPADNGKVIGYNFVDKDGEVHIIGNTKAVEDALNMELPNGEKAIDAGAFFRIVFIDKIDLDGGKTYNRFKVSALIPKAK